MAQYKVIFRNTETGETQELKGGYGQAVYGLITTAPASDTFQQARPQAEPFLDAVKDIPLTLTAQQFEGNEMTHQYETDIQSVVALMGVNVQRVVAPKRGTEKGQKNLPVQPNAFAAALAGGGKKPQPAQAAAAKK